jgi:glyoxylase-like metal-dependent hydrolase (beta-lactamase superfamily II)
VDEGARLAVLLSVFFHGRSTPAISARYATFTVPILAPSDAVERLPFGSVCPFEPEEDLPAGVRSIPTPRAGEAVFYIPRARTVIAGDVLLGGVRAPLRVCPQSWLPSSISRAALADSLAPLRDLDVDVVISGHGPPVVDDAAATLAQALESAAAAGAVTQQRGG